jgi:uncharacterized protein YcbK (DUF882 family)
MNLSENFTLEELTASQTAARNGWDNTPNGTEIANLVRLATLLENVRKVIGKPISINSGFRSKKVNDAVGSKDTSQHRIGCAADIKVNGMTPDQICQAIRASGIQFDQLIREFDSWVHISVTNHTSETPRNQMLIIDRAGTRPYV